MTIKDYVIIQWYFNIVYWVLEFIIIWMIINKRKEFKPFLFYNFLFSSIYWFADTNSILMGYLNKGFYINIMTNFILIFYSNFLFYMVIFYHYTWNEKLKKMIIPLSFLYLIASLFTINYNLNHGLFFSINNSAVSYLIVLPISIFLVFEHHPSELNYKWNLSPSYLFNIAILIELLANSAFLLFSGLLVNLNEHILTVLAIIRLFIWIAFCLFFIAGLYQLGREKK